MASQHQFIVLLLVIVHLSNSQTILSSTYTENTKLTLSGSPYQVTDSIYIEEGVTLEIENGAEIIFTVDRSIFIKGHLIAGCNDIDTSLYNDRGLADNVTFTYIHSVSNQQGTMELMSNTGSSIQICNAKIQRLYWPIKIYGDYPGDIFVDNCEFIDNYYGIRYSYMEAWYAYWYSQRSNHEIHDSIFHGHQISVSGTPFVDNIQVKVRSSGHVGDFYYATITGSSFDCDGAYTWRCIGLYAGRNIVSDSVIMNAPGTAIAFDESRWTSITHNVIKGNRVGIAIDVYYWESVEYPIDIHYNDFIDNTINIDADATNLYNDGNLHNCTLNYFGTDNEREIANKINDICNGAGSSLVIWWPYFAESVADSSSLPDPVDATNLQCSPPPNNNEPGTILSHAYFADITLTERDSPYYVEANVFIQDGITMTINNGVEIIFTGNYKIYVRGTLDCGCSHLLREPNDPKTRGVYLPKYVHIHSELYNQKGRGFRIDDKGVANICHTIFESLYYAINDNSADADNVISIDNCEFRENLYAIYGEQGASIKEVKDSIFEFNDYAIYEFDYVSIDNCLFNNNYDGSITDCRDTNVSNSEVMGPSKHTFQRCIDIIYDSTPGHLINNTVSDCYYAYYANFYSSPLSVQVIGNSFINNYVAFLMFPGNPEVKYNNFINNTFAIFLKSRDDLEFGYNYFGRDNITDSGIISDQIWDYCHSILHQGVVRFWPWLLSPFTSMNQIPDTYTIEGRVRRCPPTPIPTTSPSAPTLTTPAPSAYPTVSEIEPCDCNSIELLRVFSCGTDTNCYKYQTHFCNNDVRTFTLSVNGQRCGLQDVSTVIRNVRPVDMILTINPGGKIEIDDVMDGETFTLHLNSSQVSGTNPSGIVEYRIGETWTECRRISDVLPNYCGSFR